MGIYERQRHLVAAGVSVWGEPFRPDADALPLSAVVPTVTLATPPAPPLDVVEAEEVKFGKHQLVIIIQAPSLSPPHGFIQIIITSRALVAVTGTAVRLPAAGGRRSAAAVVG